MHFWRSPFIALAVTATIGSSRPRGSLRISCMVAMPSISGIMMSISTMSIVGSSCTRRIASRPLSADTITMPSSSSTVASAKMLRMSSSTISALRPLSASRSAIRLSMMSRSSSDSAAGLRCSHSAACMRSSGSDAASAIVRPARRWFQLPVAAAPPWYSTTGSWQMPGRPATTSSTSSGPKSASVSSTTSASAPASAWRADSRSSASTTSTSASSVATNALRRGDGGITTARRLVPRSA